MKLYQVIIILVRRILPQGFENYRTFRLSNSSSRKARLISSLEPNLLNLFLSGFNRSISALFPFSSSFDLPISPLLLPGKKEAACSTPFSFFIMRCTFRFLSLDPLLREVYRTRSTSRKITAPASTARRMYIPEINF